MQPIEPTAEHRWLQKLVGDWAYEHEASMGPDQPVQTFRGTESVRPLGDLWVVCEGQGDMPGGGTTRMNFTFGYDPAKKKFVGTFIASMMTYLWIYEGALDAAGKVLTLDTVGPSFTEPGKMVRYQDIIEMVADDHRTLTSQALGDDGQWMRFMTAQYRRRK